MLCKAPAHSCFVRLLLTPANLSSCLQSMPRGPAAPPYLIVSYNNTMCLVYSSCTEGWHHCSHCCSPVPNCVVNNNNAPRLFLLHRRVASLFSWVCPPCMPSSWLPSMPCPQSAKHVRQLQLLVCVSRSQARVHALCPSCIAGGSSQGSIYWRGVCVRLCVLCCVCACFCVPCLCECVCVCVCVC
jgi:hypothetical protein